MKVNLPQSIVADNAALLQSMATLFALNELVLDHELKICHVSTDFKSLFNHASPMLIDDAIADHFSLQNFTALVELQAASIASSVLNITLANNERIDLFCKKLTIGESQWIIVTHFSAPLPQIINDSQRLISQEILAQLLVAKETFNIVSANSTAQNMLGCDGAALASVGLTDLVDLTPSQLTDHLTQITVEQGVSFEVMLTYTGAQVMLNIGTSLVDNSEYWLVYITELLDQQSVTEQLASTLEVSDSLFESREHALLIIDSFGVISKVNSKMTALFDDISLVGKRAKEVLPSHLNQLISTSEASSHDVVIERTGCSKKMVLKHQPLRDKRDMVLGVLIEISAHVGAMDSLKYRALYAANLAAAYALFITDVRGEILFVNENFEQQTGYLSADVLGQDVSLLTGDPTGEDNQQYLWAAVHNKETWRGVLKSKKRSGVNYWSDLVVEPLLDDKAKVECIVWLSHDITMEKELQKTGTYMANYDVTTGLANAVLARDRLDGMIGRARRRKMIVAVIYIDVGGFESLEKLHGEHVSSGVLTQYCQRLRTALRAEDSLARMSKGRIAVLLPDLPNIEALEVVSAKIDKVNQRQLSVGDTPIEMDFRQGVAFFPEQGTSAESLFKNAESSLLKAWNDHNPIGCFGQAYNKKALAHFQLRRELVTAIEQRKLSVIYQPICEVRGDRLSAVEANIQWQHKRFGLIGNDEIYTMAEAGGCVQDLGFMLLHQVCLDAKYWQEKGYEDFKIGINLSHGQLRDRHVAKRINQIVQQHQIGINRLALEIPLSYIATQWLDLDEIFQELSLLGASLQYDKFGERGAYISDLRHFPFNGIKLSQTYIAQIDSDPSAANLVQGIIAMALSLNLEVTAIGVKDLSQLLQLQEMNCHFAQGDFFTGFCSRQELSQYFVQKIELS